MAFTPSQTREELARLGHSPKRSLGQNFLVDGNIVRKSLELASVGPGDAVVEVGPGLGTLTGALLEAGAEVWAVELDRNLFSALEDRLGKAHAGRLHLVEADAVKLPLAGLPAGRAPEAKVVANLPYAISTPWMDAVLSGPLPSRMVLMLQKEAAERYVAGPGTKDFGAISIFLQSVYDTEPGHRVSAACFHPKPDVDSILLNLARKAAPVPFPPAAKALVRRCFQMRRKQLGSVLRDLMEDRGEAWRAHLAERGFPASVRAEELPVSVWVELAARLPSPA